MPTQRPKPSSIIMCISSQRCESERETGQADKGQGTGARGREKQALATSRLSVTTAKEYKAFSCPSSHWLAPSSNPLPSPSLPAERLSSKKDIQGNSSLLVGPRFDIDRLYRVSSSVPVFVTAVLHDLQHPAVAQYLHPKTWGISPTPNTSSVPWKRTTYFRSTGFRHRHHPAFTAAFPSTAWFKICGLEAKRKLSSTVLSADRWS